MPYVQGVRSLLWDRKGEASQRCSEAGSAPLRGFHAEGDTEWQELSMVLGLLASLAPSAVDPADFVVEP